jgi:hypothetical protein
MGKNPILEEIYAAREALLEKYGGDVGAYLQSARERTLASGRAIENPKLDAPALILNHDQNLPEVFCWTMMGNYSGQTVKMIRQRKEHEFRYGEGEHEHTVWWGVGHNVNKAIEHWHNGVPQNMLPILFTNLRHDKPPKEGPIWVWPHVRGRPRDAMPPHVLMLSGRKGPYHVMICRFESSLLTDANLGGLFRSEYRDLVNTSRLANQQTTAIVKRTAVGHPAHEESYKIQMKAALIDYVELDDPRDEPLNPVEWKRVTEASQRTLCRAEWMDLVQSIRNC